MLLLLLLMMMLLLRRCGMVKRAPHSSMVQQGWVSKPVNVSRQTWMVGPEYTWYMRCSCIKVGYMPSATVVVSHTGPPPASKPCSRMLRVCYQLASTVDPQKVPSAPCASLPVAGLRARAILCNQYPSTL
jgi:hypothetical protein